MYKYIFTGLILSSSFFLQAAVVGSNSAVSRQSTVIFPAADTDNEMRGFAAFEHGFTLENSSTSCLYNGFFPISGDVRFNGGTLTLNQDCEFEQGIDIANVGTIDGNFHTLKFTTTSRINFPSGKTGGPQVLTLIDEKTLEDDVRSVDWSYDGVYLVVGIKDESPSQLKVYSFNGSVLTLEDSVSIGRDVNSVRWHPSDYYILCGIKSGSGDDVLVYKFDTGTKTLSKTGGAYLTGTGDAVAWHPSGSYCASSSSNNAKEVMLFSHSAGVITSLYNYNLSPSRDARRNAMDWNNSGDYLAVGFKSSSGEPDFIVFYFNGSSLSINASFDPGTDARALDWHPSKSWLAVGLGSVSESLRIYDHDSSAGTLTEKTAARVGETLKILSVAWSPDGTRLAVGRDAGTGTELRVYNVDQATAALTLVSDLDMFDDVCTVRWSPDGSYLAKGDKNRVLSVYNLPFSSEDGNMFVFNNLNWVIGSDLLLKKSIKFQGDCAINGHGHTLDFGSTASMLIDAGATLLCKDITLKGIVDEKIQCLDSLSTLSLSRVVWEQDGALTFTQGHIDFVGDVTMKGAQVFVYQSSEVSTIGSLTTLFFDAGMTFSYDASAENLLAMEDSTSKIRLCESILYSAVPGLQLTKGTVIVEGECFVESDASMQTDGIILGSGLSSSDNVKIKLLPESGLTVNSGYLVYKNI